MNSPPMAGRAHVEGQRGLVATGDRDGDGGGPVVRTPLSYAAIQLSIHHKMYTIILKRKIIGQIEQVTRWDAVVLVYNPLLSPCRSLVNGEGGEVTR